MADIRGSVVLDEDDDNLVLAVPKAGERAPANGGIPYRPGDPQGPALEPVNNADMYFDPNPRKMPVPGEVPDAQMQADIEDFTKLTGKAPQSRLDTRTGAGAASPGLPGAPGGPVVPRGTGQSVAAAGSLPTEGDFQDPNALAGTQTSLIGQGVRGQAKAYDAAGQAEVAKVTGEAQAKADLADGYAKLQADEEAKLKAMQDAELERQAAFQKQEVTGAGRSLGERIGWALATFMAGVGGKGETVLAMLSRELDRESQAETRRAIAARAAAGKPPPNAIEKRQIEASIRDLKRRKLIADAEKMAIKAGTPAAAAKFEIAKNKIKADGNKDLSEIAKGQFTNLEKQREEKQQVIGLSGQDPGLKIPITAYKSKNDLQMALMIPGAKDKQGRPLTYRIQNANVEEAKALRGQLSEVRNLLKLANETTAMIEKAGIKEWANVPTDLRRRGNANLAQMQSIAKNIIGLGVLSKTDFSFLDRMIPPELVGTLGGTKTILDQMKKNTSTKAGELLDTYGIPRESLPALITPKR